MSKFITEQDSLYDNLENCSINQLVQDIHEEDKKVAQAISSQLDKITVFLESIYPKIQQNGRLFYIGAGTSGRLGVLDASECPPTYGVPQGKIIGIIAGGDKALRNSVEAAEDNIFQGWADLQAHKINTQDVVIGIAASGSTPYVVNALQKCKSQGITTAGICCNQNSALSKVVDFPIEILVGPEFITGSTRMKAGTAQKLVLNMISTILMIKLKRVKGNKMIFMQLSNQKLQQRGIQILVQQLNISTQKAEKLLLKYKSVSKVLENTTYSPKTL